MLGATEIGCSLVKLDLSPPMDFFRRGPLSSAQRDVWMAPHIAKQAKRAAEASAAAG